MGCTQFSILLQALSNNPTTNIESFVLSIIRQHQREYQYAKSSHNGSPLRNLSDVSPCPKSPTSAPHRSSVLPPGVCAAHSATRSRPIPRLTLVSGSIPKMTTRKAHPPDCHGAAVNHAARRRHGEQVCLQGPEGPHRSERSLKDEVYRNFHLLSVRWCGEKVR